MLAPARNSGNKNEAALSVRLLPGEEGAPVTSLANESLEQLRIGNPAARALPLLAVLAAKQEQVVILEAPAGFLRVEVKPC
jgi:hypothetical protein